MPATIRAIQDTSWMKHMFAGTQRERFTVDGYRIVAIELNSATRSSYHYRMLFFTDSEQKPILSVNLETSILGSTCITAHVEGAHTNLGPADPNMSYSDFREIAVDHAAAILS